MLSAVVGLKVCYVHVVKAELHQNSYLQDRQRFYNYVALKTYRSVLWAARNWKGDAAQVWTRFGHVRGHDHRTTDQYIRRQAAQDERVPDHMESRAFAGVSADRYLESQAADLFGGFLKAALWPGGEFGYVEPSYLLQGVASDQEQRPLCHTARW